MKFIKRKAITFILAVCFVLLCAAIPSVTQVNQSTTAHANGFTSISMTEYDTSVALETIVTIEDKLQEQGTSILEVLQNQRDYYLGELNNALDDEQANILAIINTLNEAIAGFEGTAFVLPEDSNFGTDNSNSFSTYSFHMSPQCICNWLNYLTETPCGYCQAYSSYSMAVMSIVAAFKLDGFHLAAELLQNSMVNKVYGSHYTPTVENAQRLTNATHLREEIAYSDKVVYSGDFPDPEGIEHIPGITAYNADAKYGIGGYTYRKTYHSSTHVNISIKDLYDYDDKGYGSGIGDILNETCYQAQELGVITPFYTIIDNLIVPGTVPFNHSIKGNTASITGPGHYNQVTIPTHIKQFGYEDPDIDNNMPDIPVTRIESNAFSGSQLSQISIPSSVTFISMEAFKNCANLASVTIPWESWMSNRGTCSHTNKVKYLANENYHWYKCTSCYETFRAAHTMNGPHVNCACGLVEECKVSSWTISTLYHTGTCLVCNKIVKAEHIYHAVFSIDRIVYECKYCRRVPSDKEPIIIWSKPRTGTDGLEFDEHMH